MKSNLLHICFVLDENGSMYDSTSDVIRGFQKIVDEQKNVDCSEVTLANTLREDTIAYSTSTGISLK